jgi:hypothetical protein
MTVSDIIMLITLIIAIIAIINEKDRKHILLKYSKFDVFLFGVSFILINYFTYYSSFKSRDWIFKMFYFKNYGLNNPNNWGYIISIAVLFYIFYKIYYSFFPFRNLEKVVNLYKSLLEKGELTFLVDLIEKYHSNDIVRIIKKRNDRPAYQFDWERDVPSLWQKAKTNLNSLRKKLFSKSKPNRHSYANHILSNVINDSGFITFVSNKNPYFFTHFISHCKKENRQNFPDSLCSNYFKELLKSKNYWLVSELKESTNHDYGQPDRFFDDNKILASILKDLSVADVNNIWQSFGEPAIKEIQEERNMGINSYILTPFRNEELFWESRVFLSVQFFKIMVLEAIKRNYNGCHFFLHYNSHFIYELLKNLEVVNDNTDRNIHHLIKIITDNTFLWLEYYCQLDRPTERLNGYEPNGRFHDIIDCIGTNIYYLTGSRQYPNDSKIELLDKALRFYCNLDDTKSKAQDIKTKLEEILVRPSMAWSDEHPYHEYLAIAWGQFDKIPYITRNGLGEDRQCLAELKEKVMLRCGINPDV